MRWLIWGSPQRGWETMGFWPGGRRAGLLGAFFGGLELDFFVFVVFSVWCFVRGLFLGLL